MQASPKSPLQTAQDKQPTVQGERQNAAYEERSGAEELVGTTVGPWWLPPAVVALLLPGYFDFCAILRFPCDYSSVFAAFLALKWRMYLA